MRYFGKSCGDERLQLPEDVCIHCREVVNPEEITREHVPSKCLLRKPYPENLIVVKVCRKCNASFSRDEEYLSALLAAVLSGSTDPAKQKTPRDSRRFTEQPALRARIDKSTIATRTLFGETETVFMPELERVENVVLKNARCHALYELDCPVSIFSEPDYIRCVPLRSFSREQRARFEEDISEWAEVGTRMFMRQCYSFDPSQSDMLGPWVVVQEDVYRFLASDNGDGLLVRSVIGEYLATEVFWS